MTEWLVHHYNHHGIRRFYLMDDDSNSKMASYDYAEFVDPRVVTHRFMNPSERVGHFFYLPCFTSWIFCHEVSREERNILTE